MICSDLFLGVNLCYNGLFPEKAMAFVEKPGDSCTSQKAECHLPHCVAFPLGLEAHLPELRTMTLGGV